MRYRSVVDTCDFDGSGAVAAQLGTPGALSSCNVWGTGSENDEGEQRPHICSDACCTHGEALRDGNPQLLTIRVLVSLSALRKYTRGRIIGLPINRASGMFRVVVVGAAVEQGSRVR